MRDQQRTLSNREAALLRGQWWECADDGAQVWQRLSIKPTASPQVIQHATEDLAISRAVRQLKRRRVELLVELERLKGRFESVSAMPMAKLLARKELASLTVQIAAQRKLLDDLPQKPIVHRLDPDASCGVPADATTKVIAQEVTDASPPEVPAVVPTASWPPKPAPPPVNNVILAARARVEPVATPIPAAEVPPTKAPAIDSDLEALAARPFDEEMLG